MAKRYNKDDPSLLDIVQRIARLEESMNWVKENMATKSDINNLLRTIGMVKWGIGIGFTVITIVLMIIMHLYGG